MKFNPGDRVSHVEYGKGTFHGHYDRNFCYVIFDYKTIPVWVRYSKLKRLVKKKKFNAILAAKEERISKLEAAIKDILYIGECRRDEVYTSRNRHEPNTHCGDLDELKQLLAETGGEMSIKQDCVPIPGELTPLGKIREQIGALDKALKTINGDFEESEKSRIYISGQIEALKWAIRLWEIE